MPLHLLHLPWELRSQILEQIILSSHTSPSYPAVKEEVRTSLEDVEYGRPYIGKHVKWQIHHRVHPSQLLLLVNHQLNYETTMILQRLGSLRTCHADVILADEQTLWPTFLSAYTPSTHFDLVHAHFRIAGLRPRYRRKDTYTWGGLAYPGVSQHSQRCYPPRDGVTLDWTLLALLIRFLKAGPLPPPRTQSSTSDESLDRNITVSVLELNVLSRHPHADESLLPPEGITARHWFCARQNGDPDNLHAFLLRTQMRPEWLSVWLCSLMDWFRPHYFTFPYVQTCYERVGEIRVLLDGVL